MNKLFKLNLFKKRLIKRSQKEVQQTADTSRQLLNRLMMMDKPFRGVQEEV